MSKGTTSQDAPFGTLLGYAPGGVAIYSSDYNSLDPWDDDDAAFRSYIDDEYMGHKWQCVEFARRFLFLNYGVVFTDVGMAWEIFSLRFLREVVNDNILPLQAFPNGSPRAPEAGALLIWQKGGEFNETGHVAIITQLLDNKIRIAEQNVIHTPLPPGQQWTRELEMVVENGCYTLRDTFDDTTILGWMIQTDDTQYSLSQPDIANQSLAIRGARLPEKGQFDGQWLDERDPLQKAYVQANGHVINQDPYQYFTITESAEQELIKATNELHLMYLHATDKVLKDDNLLALFDIPKILWPRLRLSWQRRRHHMITGRMDFCMDERGLKVYEYNADSASCHTEAGLILEKWAEQGYTGKGHNPAEGLINELAGAWKHSKARPINQIVESIGIVIDKSLSMKSVMQYISTVQFLNIVKVDHVIWKMEVYKLLLNKDINSKITMHDQCRLGKWYYGFEGQQFSNYYSFRSLEAPHKEVHTAGHSALNYFAAGDMNAMSQELDRMERSSNEVVNQLEMLAVDLLKETTV